MIPGRYILTETAAADLDEIWEYIAEDNQDAADRVFAELLAECARIGSDPGIGHAREDLVAGRPMKFWRLYKYLIIYRTDRAPTEILAIVHGARDVESLLKDRS